MIDFIDKKQELRRYYPFPAYKLTEGQGLSVILDIVGDQLNTLADESDNAREQFLLASAQGYYLSELGKDLDVFKPKGFKMRDQVYRQLIEIITNSSKNIEYSFERLLKLFFGNNVFFNKLANVYSYEKNTIRIDIRNNALIVASSRDLYGTTYLHRSPTGHFDGTGSSSWTSSLPADLPSGSTEIVLSSLPLNIPLEGWIEIGAYGTVGYETKQYTLSGTTVSLGTPTYYEHAYGADLRGPQQPDDYPSGYIFNTQIISALSASYVHGISSITLGPGYDDFPLIGTCYIGILGSPNLESIGFTRLNNVMTLYGVTQYSHASGEAVTLPTMYRKQRTMLESPILKSSQQSTIAVENAADFPSPPFEGAIVFNRSFINEEVVPFKGRSLGDNTQMLISPDYSFIYDHSVGETVHLMALKTAPDGTGIDFAFHLNDTEGLRQQLYSLLTRIKVVGCKIVFTVY